MKKTKTLVLGIALMLVGMVRMAAAADDEPTQYTVQQGDTLWGLSERFVKDPYYWPSLWENNQGKITNPHFIYPGQRLRIYKDRIEVEPAEPPAAPVAAPSIPAEVKPVLQEAARERSFVVTGGEGMLVDREMRFPGAIVAISQNRTIAGEDDIVYVDLGREHGAKVGARYNIFKKDTEVRHPYSNVTVGVKLIPLGTLQLTELAEKSSKAILTRSFREVGPGAVVLPYRDVRRDIPLRMGAKDFVGTIVETYTGNRAIAAGEICYLDLGVADGLQVGNMLYVVRDVTIDAQYIRAAIGRLPVDVIGALVIVDAGKNTSTALVVKSVDTIYRGDRVEFRAGN